MDPEAAPYLFLTHSAICVVRSLSLDHSWAHQRFLGRRTLAPHTQCPTKGILVLHLHLYVNPRGSDSRADCLPALAEGCAPLMPDYPVNICRYTSASPREQDSSRETTPVIRSLGSRSGSHMHVIWRSPFFSAGSNSQCFFLPAHPACCNRLGYWGIVALFKSTTFMHRHPRRHTLDSVSIQKCSSGSKWRKQWVKSTLLGRREHPFRGSQTVSVIQSCCNIRDREMLFQ